MQALSDLIFKSESAFLPNSVVVDFGTVPLSAQSFTISDASATLDKNVVCSITCSPIDEMEMEPLTVHGIVSAVGSLTFLVATAQFGGLVTGQRTINYYLG